MGFSLVTSVPDVCNIKCFCYKCGLKNFPNLMSEWWCEGLCCCFFNNCGLNELMDTQICCLGPCKLTAPALNTTFGIPVRYYDWYYIITLISTSGLFGD
jgi:hypothetical protein